MSRPLFERAINFKKESRGFRKDDIKCLNHVVTLIKDGNAV